MGETGSVSRGLVFSTRVRGVLLVAGSAILFATAGVFTKIIPLDAWTVLFWRGLVAALFLGTLLLATGRFGAEVFRMGRGGLAAAVVNSLGSMAFIPAFKLTTVANVTLIYTAAPFLAALAAWLWLRERPSGRCLAAAVGAIIGVGIIFGRPEPGASVLGEALALWMTGCMAVAMVIYRRFPGTPVFGPIALSSVLVLPAGLLFSDPFAVPMADIPLLIAFGICFALAAVALMAGACLLPASETALLSLLETPLAPLLAWLLLDEIPAPRALAGGSLIVIALIWYLYTQRGAEKGKDSVAFKNSSV